MSESGIVTKNIGGVDYIAVKVADVRLIDWEQLSSSGLNVPGVKFSYLGDSYIWIAPQNGYSGSANVSGFSFGIENGKTAEVNMYASRGTAGNPSPAQAGDELTAFSGGTWRGPNLGYWIPTGEWEFRAEENINESQSGTNCSLWLTRKGTNTREIALYVDTVGNILVSPPYGTPYYNLGLLGEGVIWGATAVEPSSGISGKAGLYVKNGEWWQVKSDGSKSALGASSATQAFRAVKTADQSVSFNTLTKVTFDSVPTNQGSYYNSTNSRYTPRAGIVTLTAAANVNGGVAAGDTCQIYIYKNGSQIFGKVDFAAASQSQPMI